MKPFRFYQIARHQIKQNVGQMLKGPGLKSSGLYISVFQDRPDRGMLLFFYIYLKKNISSQPHTSDFN